MYANHLAPWPNDLRTPNPLCAPPVTLNDTSSASFCHETASKGASRSNAAPGYRFPIGTFPQSEYGPGRNKQLTKLSVML
jgi:hypothetical protein